MNNWSNVGCERFGREDHCCCYQHQLEAKHDDRLEWIGYQDSVIRRGLIGGGLSVVHPKAFDLGRLRL